MRRKEGDKASEILNAAIHVFARDGFDKAQVSAIAAVAGVGTGSIYLYFAGKNKILHTLFSRLWDHLAQEMSTLPNRDPLFRLNDQLGLFFDHLAANRDLARVYLREHHRFLETATIDERHGYVAALETGRTSFLEIASDSRDGDPHPDQAGMDLAQAFLFGGVRSALEFLLSNDVPARKVRECMLTMAMAGILAATRGNRP